MKTLKMVLKIGLFVYFAPFTLGAFLRVLEAVNQAIIPYSTYILVLMYLSWFGFVAQAMIKKTRRIPT